MLRTLKPPSIAEARSRMFRNPFPVVAASGGKPSPSSSMATKLSPASGATPSRRRYADFAARPGPKLRATSASLAACGSQSLHLRPHLLEIGPQVGEHVGRDAVTLDHQRHQDVLGSDVMVAHAAGLVESDLDHPLHPGGGDDPLDDDALFAGEQRSNRRARGLDSDAQIGQYEVGDSAIFAEQAEQEVLGPYVRVVGALGLFLRQRQDVLGAFAEAFERVHPLSQTPAIR